MCQPRASYDFGYHILRDSGYFRLFGITHPAIFLAQHLAVKLWSEAFPSQAFEIRITLSILASLSRRGKEQAAVATAVNAAAPLKPEGLELVGVKFAARNNMI